MRRGRTLDLNLATRPARNRRLYLWVRNGLVLLMAGAAGLAAAATLRYGGRTSALNHQAAALVRLDGADRKETARLTAEVAAAAKADKAGIDAVNGIIIRKSFSWTGFFTLLESALPDASYITSLTPTTADGKFVNVKMRTVSRGLDDLLALIDNLNARHFKDIRVESEAQSADGRLVSEISMNYEREI